MDREQLTKYIEETYSTSAEYVFEGDDKTAVFRHQNNRKWFAIIMEIPRSRLGLSGDETIAVVNTKCDYILISSHLRDPGHFPAYHMNKSHWITSALDGTVPKERLCSLIDISNELTRQKRKKRNEKRK